MATPADPAFRDHLRALGDKFAASVPERMRAIADAVAAAGSAPDTAQLERVHHALHTVAGSAGSFGFTALGDEARRLEQAVRAILAGGEGWPALIPQIRAYLAWATKNPRDSKFVAHD
ncbi:Hpt domain-containing protein [Pseudoduganella flava]|uniref:Hpt domain-containing protein n=1 Tax=Pseudoduganella flava TaxID=871742 RepID=A0A562PJ41_9BURK|nr:Hpt domain-containing protein [Pseudoduganella flava]QGZ37612.1 Hpt domain-containing protein [Pseudoduganella flava]TWI44026.1 Hpt domain-containing protein [Pseudoduganella flava]